MKRLLPVSLLIAFAWLYAIGGTLAAPRLQRLVENRYDPLVQPFYWDVIFLPTRWLGGRQYPGQTPGLFIVLPLLILSTLLLCRTVWLKKRRRLAGACPACGYDLRGTPESKTCPECGAERETNPA